ncbi:MAG: HAMP domain-containing sensor histidine kinase [Anaerovorax sp.]|nr:HAMP domain-containing sensor histidine kinase [Anaerovorax sp.]
MKNRIPKFIHTYFDTALDLRVRIFNVLALAGSVVSLIEGLVNLFSGAGVMETLSVLATAVLSAGLMVYAQRTQKYKPCYLVTILVIFIGLFGYLFFQMGGYHGGVPLLFVFSVVFTVFMLEGRIMLLVAVLELALYSAMYVCAYRCPDSIVELATERAYLINHLTDFLMVSIALGTTMYAQVRLYRAQQRRVDEQNAVLAQVNQAKTQFLANTSHEMRTPLTVISVNVQTVMGLLKRMDSVTEDAEAQDLLQDAQAEIMRLSRMVEGMLSLNAIADSTEKDKTDFSALLKNTAEMMRLLLSKHGNGLEKEIPDGLMVYGSADLLSQVIINLLQNANTHTANGIIKLEAVQHGGEITVMVSDNGSGISPALLPRIFERGVSEGGTGFGLFLCKTVVESHSGRIQIESEEGSGTTVIFTLPFYQGQFGGEDA